MNKLKYILLFAWGFFTVEAQDISQHISYYRIYEFLDELATDGYIDINSAVKPYSRAYIAEKLREAEAIAGTGKYPELTYRQKNELRSFINEYSLEAGELPKTKLTFLKNKHTKAALIAPGIYYRDSIFRASITPVIGMHLSYNDHGTVDKRWYGAELNAMIGKNISVYGSLRDVSHWTDYTLSGASYLNDYPGYEYTNGHDFSDSRGGIKYSNRYLSIGLMKDNIIWGDNNHGSNILSGRAPSFPMIYLQLKPAKWFELNYFHGWLVSNVADSSNYYLENGITKHYRQANKFIAANLFTFTPVRNLKLSIGNSIVYAERNIQPAYLIPIAFYKSIDHTLTKGIHTENQNSQLFFNISSRNIRHLHLFTSVYIDEIQFGRFMPDNPEQNPISYKIGANLSNFPLENISFLGEFTKTNIINYKHSIPTLTWASNSYNLGHYLGDNSQELYLALRMKLFNGFDMQFSYVDAKHGNEYEYIRDDPNNTGLDIEDIISYPSLGDIIWSNKTFGIKVTYEIFRNAYAIINYEDSDIQGHDVSTPAVFGEKRMTAQEVLDTFTPPFLQGKNKTITIGFCLGF